MREIDLQYAVTSKRYGIINFRDKESLIEYIKNNFSETAIQNLEKWNDNESYIDTPQIDTLLKLLVPLGDTLEIVSLRKEG